MPELSPVKGLSSTFNAFCSISLESAGITSPSLRKIISPVTKNLAYISFLSLSLNTNAIGDIVFFNANMLFSAL